MNILIVDDISLVGGTIKESLKKFDSQYNIEFHNYDIGVSCSENILTLSKIIIEKKINFLALDRGYSKIIENTDDYVYSSQIEIDKSNKQTVESLLFGEDKRSNKGLLSMLNEFNCSLSHLFIYTYDPFDSAIDKKLFDLKNNILKLIKKNKTNVVVIETSSIFNKPINHKLYSNSFRAHPKEIKRNTKEYKRKIGLKEVFIEYGYLIANVIKDVIEQNNSNIYSFTYKNNLILDRHVRLINKFVDKKRENRKNKLSIGTISFLARISGSETYLIDIPYKEYYKPLNKSIEESGLLSLFKDEAGNFSKRAIYYSYNYLSSKNRFELYQYFTQGVIDKSLAKRWLPYLHSGIFHDSKAWKVESVVEKKSFDGKKINIFLFFQNVNIDDFTGHINYTMYNERNSPISYKEFKVICEETYAIKYPLIRAKCTEVLIPELKNLIQKQSTRAAISQVLARNMSHNIGSHVLSKFKDTKEIKNPITHEQYIKKDSLNPNYDDNFEQIAYFNEYLKNRMDFLADIATTDPVMETPMYLFRDILKGFDKNRILLNRISGVSNDIKFEVIVLDKNGNKINNLNHSDDPLLSIPNEILGAQAFYILLENIVRNIYKHGNPKKNIEITLRVNDYFKDASFYELSVYDNIGKEESKIEESVKNRNEAFNESVLDKNTKTLRPNNLGTIEMDVCAAYLRCMPVISIENPDFDLDEKNEGEIPRLIYAYKHKLSDTDYSLGYKLYISKPKEVLVVTNDKNSFNITGSEKRKELFKAGIEVITIEELEKSEATIYNHQILYSLVSSDEFNTIIVKKQATLPKRVLFSSNQISLESTEKFIESVWEQYALKFFNENNKCYCIKNGEGLKKHISFSKDGIELLGECNTTYCHTIYIDNHNKEWANKDNWYYYDMACSHSKINKLKDAILWDNNKRLAAEYTEVINTNIVLLDERIQQNISNENRKYIANEIETPLIEYFENQKLFIPKNAVCDLNEVSFGPWSGSNCEDAKTVSAKIYRYINGQLLRTEKPDFVIIHLGVLEKMLTSGKDKNLEDIDELINGLFNNERKRLVVTSGRGKPNNLPEDIPFVPLALVQNAVETLFDKFLLTKILFNARKSV